MKLNIYIFINLILNEKLINKELEELDFVKKLILYYLIKI